MQSGSSRFYSICFLFFRYNNFLVFSLYTKNNDEHSALFARMALQHLQSIEHSLGAEFFADNELLFAAAPEISDSIAPESVASVSVVPMPALSGPASPWSNIVTGKPSQYQIQQHLLYQQQEDERQAELDRLNRQRLIRERGFLYPSVTFPHSVVNVDPNDPFIYYQQADGQYVFLNSLRFCFLKKKFRVFSLFIFPRFIISVWLTC